MGKGCVGKTAGMRALAAHWGGWLGLRAGLEPAPDAPQARRRAAPLPGRLNSAMRCSRSSSTVLPSMREYFISSGSPSLNLRTLRHLGAAWRARVHACNVCVEAGGLRPCARKCPFRQSARAKPPSSQNSAPRPRTGHPPEVVLDDVQQLGHGGEQQHAVLGVEQLDQQSVEPEHLAARRHDALGPEALLAVVHHQRVVAQLAGGGVRGRAAAGGEGGAER